MEFLFSHSIPEEEKDSCIAFYNSCKWNAIEQHPLWLPKIEASKKLTFFRALDKGKLVCFAVIAENKRLSVRVASILFGPVFNDNDALVESIFQICAHYKKAGFSALTVQLGMETGADADYIEYRINKIQKPKYSFDRENWSSLIIDLSKKEDEIRRNFSRGNKGNINRAHRMGLKVLENFSEEQFSAFAEVFVKMYTTRTLNEPEGGASLYLQNVREFFIEQNAGKFLLVESEDGKILGGIALVFQNKTMRYLKGAADPEIRNMPVLHLAMAHAIGYGKALGFDYFDLWGYNHFVTEEDQVFHINQFKRGFGGEYIFYPKKMYFVFNRTRFNFLGLAENIYKKYFKKK